MRDSRTFFQMRSLHLAALVGLFACLPGARCVAQNSTDAVAQKPALRRSGYTITVAAPDDPLHLASSTIKVTITVKNITNADIYRSSEMQDTAYKAFQYSLTKDGKEVETTFFNRRIHGRNRPDDPLEAETGSSILAPFPPGTMFVTTVDLKRLYEIKEPGEYTLDVSRFEDDNTFVHANIVTLKIVP